MSGKAGSWAFAGRTLAVWLLIAAAETVHGVLRGLWLVPAVGEAAAQRIGFVLGCAIVLGVATLASRWLAATTPMRQALAGALWCALMAAFEVLVGLARGFDLARIAGELDPGRGGLMGYGLLLMLAAPALGARLRRLASR